MVDKSGLIETKSELEGAEIWIGGWVGGWVDGWVGSYLGARGGP